MLVFFSGRRLKGGHWDDFREAWGGGDSDQDLSGLPAGAVVYHARNIKDEDEVISFGIFDVSRDELDVIRGSAEDEAKRTGGDLQARGPHPARGDLRGGRGDPPVAQPQFC